MPPDVAALTNDLPLDPLELDLFVSCCEAWHVARLAARMTSR
jgi:hypothetical protein